MDVGAISPFLWAFEEREEIATLFENISGARMHTALFKAGGLNFFVQKNDLLTITELLIRIKVKLTEVYELLNKSSIWCIRMQNVGIIDKFMVNSYGLSGPVSRSCGVLHDIRSSSPYETFKYSPIHVLYSNQGDNLTRFFLRLEEIFISLQYCEFLLNLIVNFKMEVNSQKFKDQKLINYDYTKDTMENIIYRFKSFSEGYNIKWNKSYTKVESPRGEFGVSLVSWNKILDRPMRLKVRSPGFYNLSSLNAICSNFIFSDLLSYLSTLDLILGEVDR